MLQAKVWVYLEKEEAEMGKTKGMGPQAVGRGVRAREAPSLRTVSKADLTQ